jgi:hypothetical protein
LTPEFPGLYLAFWGGRTGRAANDCSLISASHDMRNLLLDILLAAVLAGTFACTPGGTMSQASGTGPLVSSLQVETRGDSVRFLLQVTSTATEPVTLTFPSGQSADFMVLQGDRELWRWSADRMFTQAIRTETLAPGETRSYEAVWTRPAGVRGELVARGVLSAREHRVEQQSHFRLP